MKIDDLMGGGKCLIHGASITNGYCAFCNTVAIPQHCSRCSKSVDENSLHDCPHDLRCVPGGCGGCDFARTEKQTKQERQVSLKEECAPTYVDETPTAATRLLVHSGCTASGEKQEVKKSDLCQACLLNRVRDLEFEVATMKSMLTCEQRAVSSLERRFDREDRDANFRTGAAEVLHALARRIERR